MPIQKLWFTVRLAAIYGYIALLEVQQRQQHADGIRFLLRWSGYRIDETTIKQQRDELTSSTPDELI